MMNPEPADRPLSRTYTAVFLVSCSAILFEISLTRLFSISLWYHFAFMVLSIAMLGIGSAGTVLSVFPFRCRTESAVGNLSFIAGVMIIFCFMTSNLIPFDPARFSWDRAQVLYLALYCLVLSTPFFFTGALIALVFSRYSEKARTIYGCDMIGAGAGSVAVLVLLNIASPEYSVVLASSLCLAGSIIAGRKKRLFLPVVFLIINIILILVYPQVIRKQMSPYKSLSVLLKFPGAEHIRTFFSPYSRIDIFKSPGVRYAPGLSLIYPGQLPEQIGLAVDGQRIEAVTDARDRARLDFIEYLPASAAYEVDRRNDVLVIEPGGGLHVLTAQHYGSATVHKVSSDPMMIDVIRDNYRVFSGGVFERNTWTGYGRSFLGPDKMGLYDLIDLSLTGTAVTGVFGIAENYNYTVEAFMNYLKGLKADGILSISSYVIPPPRTEFRILATVAEAFDRTGIIGIEERVAAIRSWDSMTLLIKKTPFEGSEIERLKGFSREKQFDLIFYPGIRPEETGRYIKTASQEYFRGFQSILNMRTRSAFVKDYLFDIKPVHDRNPFFHYHLRLGNVTAIYKLMGEKWFYFLEEGYLLPVIFMVVTLLSVVIILVPLLLGSILRSGNGRMHSSHDGRPAVMYVVLYFSMLGLGFMFIEATLIQISVLILENPTYSATAVIMAILTGAGTGSILSSKIKRLASPYSLVALSIIVVAYNFIYPFLTDTMMSLPHYARVGTIFTLLIPLGLFMGIPFPTGIGVLGEKYNELIPWAWAINACMSVLAPVMTVMIALSSGFGTVLLIAACMYLIASITLRKMIGNDAITQIDHHS